MLLTLGLAGQATWAQTLVETDLGSQPASILVQNLLGLGVSFSNVQYVGTGGAAGTFTGGGGIIGFDNGIILSDGLAASVVGPCTDTASNCLGTPGDQDIANMLDIPVSETFDATSLSFDFVPAYNTISFQYVFASDEYDDYVGSNYDDAFAFFLNGTNVALIPGTNTYVSVNTVNLDSNSSYYIDNDPEDGSCHLNTQMHGLTTVLTVNAAVTPGVNNTIKMVIADVGDCNLDSNVFIKANSFNSGPTATPTLTPSPTCTSTPTPTFTPCGYPGNTCTPTDTPTLTPTPVSADIFYVSKNLFTPFNPVSIFVDYTAYPGHYALWVYNSVGEHIKTLADRQLSGPVSESYLWDGTNKYNASCASGVYILYLVEPFSQKMKRVVLIK